jgi:hypothetical protein
MDAIKQPIQYAGVGEYSVFAKPRRLRELGPNVTAVPGTLPNDVCLVLSTALWNSFHSLSLWIEALAVHEWCLFSERFTSTGTNGSTAPHRGDIYFLLTARPDNRRPLTWERNRIELLMMEGVTFTCPWTFKTLSSGEPFDIDHLLPLAVYPVNELWNLLPADRAFNQNEKRDRIPSLAKLQRAQPLIALSYGNYERQSELRKAVREDASLRFANLGNNKDGGEDFATALAAHTVRFIEQVAQSRSVARC